MFDSIRSNEINTQSFSWFSFCFFGWKVAIFHMTNFPFSKVDVNPAEYPGERLHVDASGKLPLPQGRQEYWLKMKDAYSGYSWDYFMANKSWHILYLKTRGMRIKTVRCDYAKG
jgi:hypothetical protein